MAEIERTGKSTFLQPNPNCLAQYALNEWIEAIPYAWQNMEKNGLDTSAYLSGHVKLATIIAHRSDEYDPVQVKVAHEILELLEITQGFPDQIYKNVAKGKQLAEAELKKTGKPGSDLNT